MKSIKRVLVKLSGEALLAADGYWLDPKTLSTLAADLAGASRLGYQIAVVIGGGNIIRGAKVGAAGWIDRATADSMGMLATIVNSIALESALVAAGASARTLSAVAMPTICETYARQPALHHIEKGRIVVLGGGTGSPFFTTDTAAVLRSIELKCDAVLKATQVDGIYSADPKNDPAATRFETLSHDEAIRLDLKIMDTAAFALARENRMRIIVGSAHGPGAITAILSGISTSTLVTP
ncbi:MAG: UMP kinase [Hyphomicrobiales bacterium]